MNVIPAIDLRRGQCVRLIRGQFDQEQRYSDDPLAVAENYVEQGASDLHIVDLDGALVGAPSQTQTILNIAKQNTLNIQVGGGIRSQSHIQDLLNGGVERVVIGTLSVTDVALVSSWINLFGSDRIVLALDVLIEDSVPPILFTNAWKNRTTINLWSLMTSYNDYPGLTILCTDISRDGALLGPNIDLYLECIERFPDFNYQASGGVSALSDLDDLTQTNVQGVIIGKALYEKRFSLGDAIERAQSC